MKSRARLFLISTITVAGLALSAWTLVAAQSAGDQIVKTEFAKLNHQQVPNLPGISNTFITGAFDKSGMYAAHGRMEKGSKFLPHSHPDIRFSVVTSGTMYLGQGETFDESDLVAYPTGTMAITPANTPHYMLAKDGDVTILELGSGPSGTKFTKN